MTKTFNHKNFYVNDENGNEVLAIYCWSTPSRNYACVRHAQILNVDGCRSIETRETIYNRAWESFEYEATVRQLARKLKKQTKAIVDDFLDKESKRTHDEAVAFTKQFEDAYSKLTDTQKESLAKSDVMIETKEQADTALGVINLMGVLNECK